MAKANKRLKKSRQPARPARAQQPKNADERPSTALFLCVLALCRRGRGFTAPAVQPITAGKSPPPLRPRMQEAMRIMKDGARNRLGRVGEPSSCHGPTSIGIIIIT
ncbi:uncharacterized protein TERG_12391 [Trichophyton rubrum CBS 118892]|uniref:Uncharacterized protein n=1 Tax=Trichophyton rubrum (strain ATCC MYA-4607 / CBS 118892) TaxID=559305 RepID=A0A080WN40_TRIRC|nr:uncharacterized protein TERG_12391 [Trichophyton rubrum CBS 118892]KFL62232.1 hypothetical protein TERG_12391 [Trichophyton rubrum CBS 118892]